jgi:hypothetical protein
VEMAKLFRDWEGEPARLAETPRGLASLTVKKYRYYYRVHFVPLMILALIGLGYGLWSRRIWELTSTFVLVLLGLFAVVWWPLPSYPAPLLVSFFGLAFLGMRYMRALSFRGHHFGYYGVRGLVVVLFFTALLNYGHKVRDSRTATGAFPPAWNIERERVIHGLENRGGQHVLLVRYSSRHPIHEEWVYNSPDIDRQRVILARAMGKADDCALVRYYPKRDIWYVYPEGGPWPQLVRVDSSEICRGSENMFSEDLAVAAK